MQRRFTERRVNANVEWCFLIGQCRGNSALFDVGVDGAFSETSLHKTPMFDETCVGCDSEIWVHARSCRS